MKYWVMAFILINAVACGRPDDAQNAASADPQSVADTAVAEAQDILEQAMQGKSPNTDLEGTEKCVIFDSGLIPSLFNVNESLISYRRSKPLKSVGHVVCIASWEKPNKAELDQAYTAAIMEWTRSMGQKDRKPQPKPTKSTNEVSLTILGDSFDTSNEAVADLESKVATLSEGISVTVGGKVHETKMVFGDWIDGVGDKAIFSDKGDLMMAADGILITVKVAAMENTDLDHEKAIELASQIIPQL